MTGVLKPGVRLLERFSFARKFQLVFVLFALPLGFSLWVISSSYLERLRAIDHERQGMQALQAMADVQRALIEQRTLLARWKGTDSQAQALMQQRAGSLDQALQALAAPLQDELVSEQARQHFQGLEAGRGALSVDSLGKLALPDALERYQKTLLGLLALREQVATDSGLILDPQLDTYLMMEQLTYTLPRLLEQLGSFASQGHGAVVSQHFTLQSRVLIRDLRRNLDESRSQLLKAQATLGLEAPEAMRQLQEPYSEALQGYESFLAGIDRDMFEASPMALTPEQFVQRIELLQGQLNALQQALYRQFDASLGDYRGTALTLMTEAIGVFSLLTLLALYVLFCLNASIRRSTAGIILAAEGLRDGDLRVRMQVHGADDLASIAQALNAAVSQLRDSMQGVNQQSLQLGNTVGMLNGEAQNALQSVEQQQARAFLEASGRMAGQQTLVEQLLENLRRLPAQRVTEAPTLQAGRIIQLDGLGGAAEDMLLGHEQGGGIQVFLLPLRRAYIREGRVVFALQGLQVAAVPGTPVQAMGNAAFIQHGLYHLGQHAAARQGLAGKGRVVVAGNQTQVVGLGAEAQARQQADQHALQHQATILGYLFEGKPLHLDPAVLLAVLAQGLFPAAPDQFDAVVGDARVTGQQGRLDRQGTLARQLHGL